MKIGILSLQGSIKEHSIMLKKCNITPTEVRLPRDMKDIDGLIIPGGESTTIGRLMQTSGLEKEIKKRYTEGLPIYGSCAGAILLAKEVIGSNQPNLNLMGISIRRNDYGRQIESFETDLNIKNFKKAFRGIFIRAPIIEAISNDVKILSEFKNKPVMVQQGNLLATTFHPELTNDIRVHKYFIGMARKADKMFVKSS